ncbi:hypothetical protein JL721_10115 [Aureococcus anophagefferens]|nr:hypothetical protein JL721_10115 [Aureococcus anophagefferens]
MGAIPIMENPAAFKGCAHPAGYYEALGLNLTVKNWHELPELLAFHFDRDDYEDHAAELHDAVTDWWAAWKKDVADDIVAFRREVRANPPENARARALSDDEVAAQDAAFEAYYALGPFVGYDDLAILVETRRRLGDAAYDPTQNIRTRDTPAGVEINPRTPAFKGCEDPAGYYEALGLNVTVKNWHELPELRLPLRPRRLRGPHRRAHDAVMDWWAAWKKDAADDITPSASLRSASLPPENACARVALSDDEVAAQDAAFEAYYARDHWFDDYR